jgi:DNA polymerase-3 subunit epsilon
MGITRDIVRRWQDRTRRDRAARVRGRVPEAVADYLARPRPPIRRADPMAMRFAVIDIEATGLDPRRDRILTIAGVAVTGGRVDAADAFECVLGGEDVGGHAATIHGMIRRDVRDGLAPAAGLAGLLAWLGDAVLVAHHVAFDAAILDRHLAEAWPEAAHRGRVLWNPRLDTALLARRLEQGTGRHGEGGGSTGGAEGSLGLDAVCRRHGVSISGRHTAGGDALATAMLLLPLLAMARRRGVRTGGMLLG